MSERMVLFDLDGTLADTLVDIAASMNRALVERGYPAHPVDSYRYFVGDGIERVAQRVLPADAAVKALDLVAAFRADYRDHLMDATRPYEGIPPLLDALVARGVKLAIVSNKPENPAKRLTGQLFERWSFVAVHGQSEAWPLKPDPTLSLAIASAAGIPPERCLFVGDSDVDMRTGRAAGMRPVGVLWGFRDRSELEAAGAQAVIERPADLLPLVDALGRG